MKWFSSSPPSYVEGTKECSCHFPSHFLIARNIILYDPDKVVEILEIRLHKVQYHTAENR